MGIHLFREIENLKRAITLLAGMVEKNLQDAAEALMKRDENLARRVHAADRLIDLREVEIEEECLKILALHQPVARDLRLIISVLKLNNDLERIGDEATNISARALKISSLSGFGQGFDFSPLFIDVIAMVKASFDSMINTDAQLARSVLGMDKQVDLEVREKFDLLKGEIRSHPDRVDILVEYLRVCRHLERVADHATNIAEDVIYLIEGSIVRHQP